MKYRYLYQITNLVNNKIYVGVHVTDSLNDGYMGSGKVIKSAIKKHGLDSFKKDILEFFMTDEEMYAREKEVVTEEFLSRNDVYNLRRGGTGGFDYINSHPEKYLTEKRLNSLSRSGWIPTDKQYRIEQKVRAQNALAIARAVNPTPFKGKKHSEESKRLMSLKAKQRAKE